MDKCLELLDKIAGPLNFSASDGGRHLPLIKDLGRTMTILAARLGNEILRLFSSAPERPCELSDSGIIAEFTAIFADFDRLPPDQKPKRVEKALLLIREIKNLLTQVSPATPYHSTQVADNISVSENLAVSRGEKLSQPVLAVKGVGVKTVHLLERKGLTTVEDMIYFLPRRYEDRRFPVKISQARVGIRETITGTVRNAEIRHYGKRQVFEVTIEDDTGLLKAKWFKGNPTYLRGLFKNGSQVIFTGNTGQFQLQKEMLHPDFEVLDQESDNLLHFKRIVPIYSETEGLYQKSIRRIMKQVVDEYLSFVRSPIPAQICQRKQLIDIGEAFRQVHFPALYQNIEDYNAGKTAAHRRLIFDELFFFQLGMALKRKGLSLEAGIAFKTGGPGVAGFYRILPFALTTAQERVIKEIEADMARAGNMNRLLQGDVGCGKTVIAMAAMVTACDNGYQAALMAPTEILAEQHYGNIKKWAEALSLNVVLLTGKMGAAEKRDAYGQIKEGKARLIIGTHALIQSDVIFHKLGLAVIDEQHRFGVIQRAALRAKGDHPDILVMTATPIPRTLAMTVYGDLDVSVIDAMPPGHEPVRTKVYFERQRSKVYELIEKEVGKKHQVFIVYPLVEESEHLDMKDATGMAEHLQKEIFPKFQVGLIHGKMKRAEKEEIMAAFREKRMDILVATTVIEVGIDIPEASLMVIEHAERFGLSQLHQLRGRVGRSDIASSCILLAQGASSADAGKRLRIMEKTTDGFVIAEEDLVLRGPGEFMGVRQSGLPDFRIANLIRDGKILQEAKDSARELVEEDPGLTKPEHRLLKEVLMTRWSGRLELAITS